ncbi:MAG: hypothetical protein KGL74_00990 [Elusimicrobia bacterium]|nr:hypothetical protein [Elusimicrobiota bacterium]MDE2509670.1 hypothetical protein [Elusimicrobiota bacterium]
MIVELLLPLLLTAAPARAGDWLLDAQKAAASAPIAGEAAPEKPKSAWVPYEPASRLFRGDLPSEGWHAFEEDDALGSVVRVLGPDDPSGALRATLTVRLMDRDAPDFIPAKEAVDAMRRSGPGRDPSPVHPLRVSAGLARIFEIVERRRVPIDQGPSAPMDLHQYVAVIPRGEAYFLVRLTTARENYLDYRDLFVTFVKNLKPIGAR